MPRGVPGSGVLPGVETREERRVRFKKYHEEHREERNAYCRRRWREHPEYFVEYKRIHAAQMGESSRLHERRRNGIKNATGELRFGKCLICGAEDVKLCCDHNHVTGEIRGWPCCRCNRAIGLWGDDIVSVGRALSYLKGELHGS